MIRFLNVTLQHIPDRGIKGITFAINRGEFVLLNGPTGAGKTTILRLIFMELAPDSGQIRIEGRFQKFDRKQEIALLRRKMGIVFPEARLLPYRTIFENVALPLQIIGESRKHTRLQVNRWLFRFGLKEMAGAYPAELSSGEQKKVAIARALVVRPFILLADEPLANIDANASQEILDNLSQIKQEGMTILAATHTPDPYSKIADRILQIENGRLTGEA